MAVRFNLTEANCPKHPSNCKPEWIEDALAKGVHYFILEEEGEFYGCVGLEQAGPEVCYLERLAVLPVRQHQGYGWALVGHVMTVAKGWGSHQIDIGIIAAHTELKEWYKKSVLLNKERTISRIFRSRSFLCQKDWVSGYKPILKRGRRI